MNSFSYGLAAVLWNVCYFFLYLQTKLVQVSDAAVLLVGR